MAGMMSGMGGMPGQPGQAMGAPDDESAAAEGEEGGANVTPEEQAAYDAFVNNAYRIIYSPKTFAQVLNRMKVAASQDPVEALAATVVMVVVRVEESARRNGQDIADEVVFHAGVEILESLADTAAKAQIHQYDEKEIEAASLRAMDIYREMAGKLGLIDQDKAKADFAKLQQADQEGKLDEIIPKAAIDRFAPQGKKALAQAEQQPQQGGGLMNQRQPAPGMGG